MKPSQVILVLLFACCAICFEVYEPESPPGGWMELAKAPGEALIPFRVALKQRNLDILADIVLRNSNPHSPSYGQHLSIDEILDLVAPPRAVAQEVIRWLENHGVKGIVNMRDCVKAYASVRDLEMMLETTLFVYEHTTGKKIIRSKGSYFIPDEYKDTVEMVTGLTEFPFLKNNKHKYRIPTVSDPGMIVPGFLQALYDIPSSGAVNLKASLCVVEFMGDSSFNATDMEVFSKMMAMPLIKPSYIIGPFNGASPDAESTLDIQYAGAMSLNTSLWFWTVGGWMYDFATDLFNRTDAPWVVSMSWGWPEQWQCQSIVGNCSNRGWTSQQYVERCNAEYLKLGARGITLLAASGDQGAPGDMNYDCQNTTFPLSNLFPASSPWVTAVGATMLQPSSRTLNYTQPPICKTGGVMCAYNGSEGVCTIPESLITTGGGFSAYSLMPAWQSRQVAEYLKSGVSLPPAQYFNKRNRAYPDVSALGHGYIIQWGGGPVQVDGTSCSAPVVGAMVALWNSARFDKGKSSLGFMNPVFYEAHHQNPNIYNDITAGNNKCTEMTCCKYGFEAGKGWDPVTGLGTPNWKIMQNYVLSLK